MVDDIWVTRAAAEFTRLGTTLGRETAAVLKYDLEQAGKFKDWAANPEGAARRQQAEWNRWADEGYSGDSFIDEDEQ